MKNCVYYFAQLSVVVLLSFCVGCTDFKIQPNDTYASHKGARTATYTARDFFSDMQQTAINQGYNVGGSEGLYAASSGKAAFDQMALASDVTSSTWDPATRRGQIRDNSGNIWQLYPPSATTVKDFVAAGITIKASIDWSSYPNGTPRSQKKLRFTQD